MAYNILSRGTLCPRFSHRRVRTPLDPQDEYNTQQALLYIAMSRARDYLWLSGGGKSYEWVSSSAKPLRPNLNPIYHQSMQPSQPTFEWVSFFEELANQLLAYEDRQPELIEILRKAGAEVADDTDHDGRVPLQEIDPFSFVAHFHKYGDERRIAMCRAIKPLLSLQAPIPTSFQGIPSINALAPRYFDYKKHRRGQEIPLLWKLAKETIAGAITPDTFDQVQQMKGIQAAKLSAGLFYLRPREHFPFNKQVQTLLKEKGMPGTFNNFAEYQQALAQIRTTFDIPFYELSRQGWAMGQEQVADINPEPISITQEEAELIRVMQKIGDRDACETYFELLGELTSRFELAANYTDRVVSNMQKSGNFFALMINFRYVWGLKKEPSGLVFFFMTSQADAKTLEEQGKLTKTSSFRGGQEPPVYLQARVQDFDDSMRQALLREVPIELARSKNSKNLRTHQPILLSAATDPLFLQWMLDLAFTNKTLSHLPVPNRTPLAANTPLNQILYGPPGTGKTYQTMSRAVGILDGTAAVDREALKQRYRELVNDGRIVFTTFHQSFSYQEFVEGIRAETHHGHINYKVQPGIFVQISRAATLALGEQWVAEQPAAAPALLSSYEELYDAFQQEISQKLADPAPHILLTSTGKEMEIVEITSQGNINMKHLGAKRIYTVSRSRLKKLWQAYEGVHDINNIDQDIRTVIGGANSTAYWALFKDFKRFEAAFESEPDEAQPGPAFKEADIDKLDFSELTEPQLAAADRYVLIIDEINRGNIAKILGELITLLEPSKRLGGEDEQRVTLPYSKQRFGVPPNLHLIGTMNTADRSIARLDTALRRRFHFEEVMPDPSLLEDHVVAGVALDRLLDTLNQRIEYLYDRDHTLGHAYFLQVENQKQLNTLFRDRIIPLLQEYFYGDWEKICLVLGDHEGWGKPRELRLLINKSLEGRKLFAEEPDYQPPQHHEINPELKRLNMPAKAFIHIYQQTLSE